MEFIGVLKIARLMADLASEVAEAATWRISSAIDTLEHD
jgi:hypothetical protein